MSFHSDPFHTDSSIHSMNVPSHEGEPVGLQRTSPNQMLSSRDKVEGEQSNKGLLKTDASFMKEYKGSLTKAGGAALMAVGFTGSVMLLPLTVAGGALGAGAALIAKARGMSDEQAGKLLTAGLIVGSLGSLGIGLAGVKLHSEGEKYSQKLAEKKEQPLAKEQLLHPSHRGLEESVSENKISSPEVSDVREPEIMHTVELSPKEIYQALIDTSKKKLEELAAKKEAIRNVDIPVAKEKIKESEEGILFAKNKLVESKAQYAAHLNEIRNDTSDPSKKRRLEEKVSEYEKADKHRKEELVKYSLMTLFQTELLSFL